LLKGEMFIGAAAAYL